MLILMNGSMPKGGGRLLPGEPQMASLPSDAESGGNPVTMTTPPPFLPFTPDDVLRAHDAWGCSCGPAALAACLGVDLDAVRRLVAPEFEQRRYMNTTMMLAALARAGCRSWQTPLAMDAANFVHSVARIQ